MAVVPKPEPQDAVLPPAPAPKPKPAAPAKPRGDALKELAGVRRVTAWPVHRWPLEKRVVRERTRVHLPRTYRARHGADVRTVYPGTDLNQFVHRHYCEDIGAEREGAGRRDVKGGAGAGGAGGGRESEKEKRAREEWPNYVSGESVMAKRHEYLGPDPRVAGYRMDADGEYHIKWYDPFLKDHWMDDQKWDFDVRLDARGNWVEVDDDVE